MSIDARIYPHDFPKTLFSDLHIEPGPFEPDPQALKEADLVVAVDNIGVARQSVEWLKTLNKPVAWVLGNHVLCSQGSPSF